MDLYLGSLSTLSERPDRQTWQNELRHTTLSVPEHGVCPPKFSARLPLQGIPARGEANHH
jgi:hypothetical protein